MHKQVLYKKNWKERQRRRRGAEEGEKGNELLKKKVLEGERDGAKENLNVEKHIAAAEVSAIGTVRS